jgi:hypothetical protein
MLVLKKRMIDPILKSSGDLYGKISRLLQDISSIVDNVFMESLNHNSSTVANYIRCFVIQIVTPLVNHVLKEHCIA